MALTIQEALDLKEGAILSFGTEYQYFVLHVEPRDRGRGVYLALKRDDGFDTYATHHDLHKAVFVGEPVASETIVAPNITAEELETLGSDPDVQQEIATIAAEENGELPSVTAPELPVETVPLEAQRRRTAVADKSAPRGKGKGKGKKA